MPKRTTALELVLRPRGPGESAISWLCGSLQAEILDGRLRPGSRLPATRDLARQYGLSRGTIVSAFNELKAQGYVEGSVGSGTFVSATLPDDLLLVDEAAKPRPEAQGRPRRRPAGYGRRVRLLGGYSMKPVRAFRPNRPALDLFPVATWAQVTARRLRRATTHLLLGTDAAGYPPLRQAVADYLAAARGVTCDPGQVLVVSGVQEAMDLTARVLLDPGDAVCVEDPGYDGARHAFEAFGARVRNVPVDAEGMTIPRRARVGAKLAYVTPAHQFPLGVGMSLRRRLDLIEWARAAGAMLFEDDYDSEFRFAGRPLPALQGLDRHGLVLFAGTFGKVLFPSLRLGYLVVPPDLVDTFAAAKSVSSQHAPLIEQAVLCDFIAEGHFGRHIRRMREVYAGRLGALREEADRRLKGLLEISPVEAGLQTAGFLLNGMDGETAARAALERNVEVGPISRYTRGPVLREGLQLGFAAVDEIEIRRGVAGLAAALRA